MITKISLNRRATLQKLLREIKNLSFKRCKVINNFKSLLHLCKTQPFSTQDFEKGCINKNKKDSFYIMAHFIRRASAVPNLINIRFDRSTAQAGLQFRRRARIELNSVFAH